MTQYILFYSKYSQPSSFLIYKIQQHESYFTHLQRICIDNKNVRSQIEKSDNKINLTYVPSLFVINSNGIVESFEGPSAVEWIDSIIAQNKEPVIIPEVKQSSIPTLEIKEAPKEVTAISDLPANDSQRAAPPQLTRKEQTASQKAQEMQQLRELEDKLLSKPVR